MLLEIYLFQHVVVLVQIFIVHVDILVIYGDVASLSGSMEMSPSHLVQARMGMSHT